MRLPGRAVTRSLTRRRPSGRSDPGAIGARALHPRAQGRLRQIKVARHGADALAFIENQPNGLGSEVVIEPATGASPLGAACYRCGHRTRLSEDVHQTGSSPMKRPNCVSIARTAAFLYYMESVMTSD